MRCHLCSSVWLHQRVHPSKFYYYYSRPKGNPLSIGMGQPARRREQYLFGGVCWQASLLKTWTRIGLASLAPEFEATNRLPPPLLASQSRGGRSLPKISSLRRWFPLLLGVHRLFSSFIEGGSFFFLSLPSCQVHFLDEGGHAPRAFLEDRWNARWPSFVLVFPMIGPYIY